MTDGGPQRQVLGPALRRFWLVAALAAVLSGVLAAWLVQAGSSTSWSAQATYVVPLAAPTVPEATTPPTSVRPEDLQDASRYAATYAVLLVEDMDLLTELGDAAGMSAREVAASTAAVTVPGTPIIRVEFVADTAEQVQAYFDRLEEAVSTQPSVTPNIPAGNLRSLRPPQLVEQPGIAPLAPVAGIVIGLLVGLGVAVLLERLDPRLRSAADVRELADWPVLELSEGEGGHADVVSQRALSAAPHVRTVAVLGVAGLPDERVEDVARRLAAAADRRPGVDGGATDPTAGGRTPDGAGARWSAGGALAGDGAAESLAQRGDVVLLVAPVHSRLRDLDVSVRSLQDLAVEPVLVALVPDDKRRGSAGKRDDDARMLSRWPGRDRRGTGEVRPDSSDDQVVSSR